MGWDSKIGSWSRLENCCVLGEDVQCRVGGEKGRVRKPLCARGGGAVQRQGFSFIPILGGAFCNGQHADTPVCHSRPCLAHVLLWHPMAAERVVHEWRCGFAAQGDQGERAHTRNHPLIRQWLKEREATICGMGCGTKPILEGGDSQAHRVRCRRGKGRRNGRQAQCTALGAGRGRQQEARAVGGSMAILRHGSFRAPLEA